MHEESFAQYFCMQQQDHVWQLVADYLSGEASPEALQELQQIMHDDPIFKNTVELLFEFFFVPHKENSIEIDDAWQRHVKKIGEV
jgi:hypothetical protein